MHHYLIEFMKFLCGFAMILAVSITLLYVSNSDVTALTILPFFA